MMEYIKLLRLLFAAMPEIIRLIKQIEKDGNEKKLKEDLDAIEHAFKNKDADALNRAFNK